MSSTKPTIDALRKFVRAHGQDFLDDLQSMLRNLFTEYGGAEGDV